MGTFAETAIVDLLTKENKFPLFFFRFQQTSGNLSFPFSVCSKQTEVPSSVSSVFRLWNSGNMELWTWGHGDRDMGT
jgi:hypothetical protein